MNKRSACRKKTTYIHSYFHGNRYHKHIGMIHALQDMFPSSDMETDDKRDLEKKHTKDQQN
jgi:hypothetical protein